MGVNVAYRDLREYLSRLEEERELRHIAAEVDWDLEMGAISRRAIELRGPALLFENIRGYSPAYRVVANAMAGTRPVHGRFALALGLPKETPTLELITHFAERCQTSIKPTLVSTGPCKEEVHL